MNFEFLFLLLLISFPSLFTRQLTDPETVEWIQQSLPLPQPNRMQSHLFNLTQTMHVAGTPSNDFNAKYLINYFESFNIPVEMQNFTTMITYPIDRSLEIIGNDGSTEEVSLNGEDPMPGDPTSSSGGILPFNAYSANGDVVGELVYVNYGREEDFDWIKNEAQIDVKGKIGIIRYGVIFRGEKIRQAEINGMIGVILYSDPSDDGYGVGDEYMEGPFKPENGVERGSVQYFHICPGDPRRVSYCLNVPSGTDPKGLLMPKIPVTPLSWGDAATLLWEMGGLEVPSDWQGGLEFNYTLGPSETKIRLYVNNSFEVRELTNIVATITGYEYPSEFIVVGNHRDAWTFGALDPGSGTVTLLETVQTLFTLLESGWKPKRSIIFAFWDGEEYGLLGSTNYGEVYTKNLMNNAMAYINVDIAVSGPNLYVRGNPALDSLVYEMTSYLNDPKTNESLDNIWDTDWIDMLGSGSDYTVFNYHLGIPSLDFGFKQDQGVYHTIYDSYTWMTSFGDPDFLYHKLASQFLGSMVIALTTNGVVPLCYNDTSYVLYDYYDELSGLINATNVTSINLTDLENALDDFSDAVVWQEAIIEMDRTDPELVPILNGYLLDTERFFIEPKGLPGRYWYKHVINAPDVLSGYDGESFPGTKWALLNNNETMLQEQVNLLVSRINNVTDYLNADPVEFIANSNFRKNLAIGLSVGFFSIVVIILAFTCRRSDAHKKATLPPPPSLPVELPPSDDAYTTLSDRSNSVV